MMKNFHFCFFSVIFTNAHLITYIDEVMYWGDPLLMEGPTILEYDGDGHDHTKYRVSFNVNIFAKGINFVLINAKAFTSPPGKRNDSEKLMDVTVDFCSLLKKGRSGNIFFMKFMEFYNYFGKIPSKCPIPPALYYLKNASFNAVPIPAFFTNILTGHKDGIIKYKLDAKLNNSKTLKTIVKVTIFGGYMNI